MNTKQLLQVAAVSALVSVIVSVGLGLVSNQSGFLGAVGQNRFPNSTLSARGLRVSTSTNPTQPSDGTLIVTGSTTLSGPTSITGTTTVTAIDFTSNCNTATIATSTELSGIIPAANPATLTTTTNITLTGSLVTDKCFASL